MIEARLFPKQFVAVFENRNLRKKFNVGDPCNVPDSPSPGQIKTIAAGSVTVVSNTNTVRITAQEFANVNKDFNWG